MAEPSRMVGAPSGRPARRSIFRLSAKPTMARNGLWTSVTVVEPVR
jgi:hypothetical protein